MYFRDQPIFPVLSIVIYVLQVVFYMILALHAYVVAYI